ncbi:PH domain-containing protein [Winogradskyella sp. A3E31]|uniref:PH domain-containing protein n=1 Tax=Winogradskyella sp. A3E31 TaxID=3349637 RepID=UPI00398BBB41
MFTNAQIELESLPKLDDVTMTPISKKYLNIILINKFILFAIAYSALIMANIFANDVLFTEYFWYLILVLTVILAVNLIFSVLAFRKRKYALREKDVIYSKGLLFLKLTVVPISRIQHIEETRTWLARQFGLASLKLFTAGESGTDLSIRGLTEDEARRINDFLSAKVDAED